MLEHSKKDSQYVDTSTTHVHPYPSLRRIDWSNHNSIPRRGLAQDRDVGQSWNTESRQGNIPSESISGTLKLLPTGFLLRHNGGVDIGVGTVNWREMRRCSVPYK